MPFGFIKDLTMKSYQRCFGALLNSKRFKLKDFFKIFPLPALPLLIFCPPPSQVLPHLAFAFFEDKEILKTKNLFGSAKQSRAATATATIDGGRMMMMRTDRVDVINDERQRSCSGARSNPAHTTRTTTTTTTTATSDERRAKKKSAEEKERRRRKASRRGRRRQRAR